MVEKFWRGRSEFYFSVIAEGERGCTCRRSITSFLRSDDSFAPFVLGECGFSLASAFETAVEQA